MQQNPQISNVVLEIIFLSGVALFGLLTLLILCIYICGTNFI